MLGPRSVDRPRAGPLRRGQADRRPLDPRPRDRAGGDPVRHARHAVRRADRPSGPRPRAVRADDRVRQRGDSARARSSVRGFISAPASWPSRRATMPCALDERDGHPANVSELLRSESRAGAGPVREPAVAGVPGRGQASAGVVPYPEVVGYEVDAQRALGERPGPRERRAHPHDRADRQRAARSDRLLAVYYAGHRRTSTTPTGSRPASWPCATTCSPRIRWPVRRHGRALGRGARADRQGPPVRHRKRAARLPCGNHRPPRGDRDAARRWLDRAVALNPQFHAVYADDARAKLTELR